MGAKEYEDGDEKDDDDDDDGIGGEGRANGKNK